MRSKLSKRFKREKAWKAKITIYYGRVHLNFSETETWAFKQTTQIYLEYQWDQLAKCLQLRFAFCQQFSMTFFLNVLVKKTLKTLYQGHFVNFQAPE